MPDERSNDLNFDKAEYEGQTPQAAACNLCQAPLAASYYEINGKVVCPSCKDKVEGISQQGGGLLRFLKALGLGIPAAALGSGIYYGIAAFTGYEFGLVAVVIGLLVGGAVRMGSNRRGGWVYQALAIFLTYLSITSTYLPSALQAYEEGATSDSNSVVRGEDASGAAALRDEASGPVYEEGTDEGESRPARDITVAIFYLTLFTLALPFLYGFKNVIGLLIIGFALYEAWKLNRRMQIRIAGPFDLGSQPSP